MACPFVSIYSVFPTGIFGNLIEIVYEHTMTTTVLRRPTHAYHLRKGNLEHTFSLVRANADK